MALLFKQGTLHASSLHQQPNAPKPARYWHSIVVRASSSDSTTDANNDKQANPEAAKSVDVTRNLPNKGYFAIADTKAEVYSKAGEKFDPTKKPGRYKSDFIWNSNWQETLKIQEQLEEQRKEYEAKKEAGELNEGGFLNMSRAAALDDMSIDLTPLLLKKKEPLIKSTPAEPKPKKQRKVGTDLPTVREAKRYTRGSRAAARQAPVIIPLDPTEKAEIARQAIIDRERYDQLKLEFQLWTVGAATLGGAVAYLAYSEDIAYSYILGSIAGLTYLRLLGKSVDSLGTGSAEGSFAQPRLLIPVILALASTKWNRDYADHYGTHLQLIPMLLGFFTYKFAVIGRQTLQLMQDFTADMQKQRAGGDGGSSGEAAAAGAAAGGDAASKESELEKLFISKVWQQ